LPILCVRAKIEPCQFIFDGRRWSECNRRTCGWSEFHRGCLCECFRNLWRLFRGHAMACSNRKQENQKCNQVLFHFQPFSNEIHNDQSQDSIWIIFFFKVKVYPTWKILHKYPFKLNRAQTSSFTSFAGLSHYPGVHLVSARCLELLQDGLPAEQARVDGGQVGLPQHVNAAVFQV